MSGRRGSRTDMCVCVCVLVSGKREQNIELYFWGQGDRVFGLRSAVQSHVVVVHCGARQMGSIDSTALSLRSHRGGDDEALRAANWQNFR